MTPPRARLRDGCRWERCEPGWALVRGAQALGHIWPDPGMTWTAETDAGESSHLSREAAAHALAARANALYR